MCPDPAAPPLTVTEIAAALAFNLRGLHALHGGIDAAWRCGKRDLVVRFEKQRLQVLDRMARLVEELARVERERDEVLSGERGRKPLPPKG